MLASRVQSQEAFNLTGGKNQANHFRCRVGVQMIVAALEIKCRLPRLLLNLSGHSCSQMVVFAVSRMNNDVRQLDNLKMRCPDPRRISLISKLNNRQRKFVMVGIQVALRGMVPQYWFHHTTQTTSGNK